MNLEMTRGFFMWCSIINYAVLVVWFVALLVARDAIFRLHGRWFNMSAAQIEVIHYAGIAAFKLAVILFNVVPFIALCIIG